MTTNNENTAAFPRTPCYGCKRKNCTMSVFYGKTCEFAINHDYTVAEGKYDYKPKNYVKRNHNKKRSYHRGKF